MHRFVASFVDLRWSSAGSNDVNEVNEVQAFSEVTRKNVQEKDPAKAV